MRLLPSEAADMIRDSFFPEIDAGEPGTLGFNHLHSMTQMLAIVEAVPDELIIVAPTDMTAVITGRASLAGWVATCRGIGNNAYGLPGGVVSMLYGALRRMPDRVLPAAANRLAFVLDAGLRDSIRDDLASVETSLRDADWKAATVMAGSAAEALLLWNLQGRKAGSINTAVRGAIASGGLQAAPPTDRQKWTLHQYIEVAGALEAITAETVALLRVTKEFRNLIHPGKAIRTGLICDRGTARAASAGVDFLIRDFTR